MDAKTKRHVPPKSLQKSGRAYWQKLHGTFGFEETDLPVVEALCKLIDRMAAIGAAIDAEGVSVTDRFGSSIPNRLLEHERASALAAGRLWRELGLGSAGDTDPSKLPLNTRTYR